jgi:hypothetical protein
MSFEFRLRLIKLKDRRCGNSVQAPIRQRRKSGKLLGCARIEQAQRLLAQLFFVAERFACEEFRVAGGELRHEEISTARRR